jgi:hypothetical protein
MSWPEFLKQLNPTGSSNIAAVWRVSDGSSFRKEVPPADQLGEEIADEQSACVYKLYEVTEMEFEASNAEQLDMIEQAARTSGLIYRRKPERIIVRSPYTC